MSAPLLLWGGVRFGFGWKRRDLAAASLCLASPLRGGAFKSNAFALFERIVVLYYCFICKQLPPIQNNKRHPIGWRLHCF